ncbi:hypothetical protein PMAYCL1PPCAC_08074, partial [Pristionchus mayeri]
RTAKVVLCGFCNTDGTQTEAGGGPDLTPCDDANPNTAARRAVPCFFRLHHPRPQRQRRRIVLRRHLVAVDGSCCRQHSLQPCCNEHYCY